MDSPRGNIEDPQNAALHHPGGGQDEGDLHVEKQSFYKRVKAKAKKMKASFKGHGDDKDVDDVDDDNVDGGHEINLDDHAAPGYGSTTTQDIELEQGRETPRQHEGNLDEGATIEGASHTPESKPVENQTFDTTTSIYIPGEEETLGRSRTDTGGSKLSEEQPDSPKKIPVLDHRGHYHTEFPETGEMEKFAKHEDRPSILEKDPHASRDVGEKLHAENYQTEVTDPTGRGAEEIGGTPIVHELGKMNIHDESTQKLDLNTGQQEDKYKSIGNQDQFSPEAVTKPQLDATIPTSQGFHDEEEQKPESYNDKVSHETPTNELAKMNIHDESTQKVDLNTGQQEDKYKSIGNQDQFSPVAVTKPQFDATIPNSQGFHDMEKQKPESYNDKIPHDSSTNADSTVSFDQQPDQDSLDKKPVAGGYRETVSSISSSITNTVLLAKDAVASKLGYGETEEQSGPEYQVGSTDSSSDKGVLGKEDNALSSKVINEALPVHKANVETPIDEATKAAKEERETELNEEKKVVVKGRVTDESEEVANRLGKAEDTDYNDGGPGLASPGKSVMERLRVVTDAAGSWFNKSGGEPHVEPQVELGDRIEEGNDRTQASTIKETGLN